jgi:hypothetical protein
MGSYRKDVIVIVSNPKDVGDGAEKSAVQWTFGGGEIWGFH